jgi:hypothetical protein
LVALGLGIYVALKPTDKLAILGDTDTTTAEPTATPYQSLGDQVYAEALETPEPASSPSVTTDDAETTEAVTVGDSSEILSSTDENPVSGNLDTSDLFDL